MGASARYRVYQYLDFLKKNGIEGVVSPAVKDSTLKRYCGNPGIFNKITYYSSIIGRRMADINHVDDFDCIFFQRDILIHAYPFIEMLIALKHKKIIFDFDDAIYLYPTNKKAGFLFKAMMDTRKIERIIRLSKHVIVGNIFLKNYAHNFTNNVTVIPTSINTALYKTSDKPRQKTGKITIGWMGSQGTFSYLENIFPVLIELAKKYNIELKIIGAKGSKVKGLDIVYKDWDLATEIEDILSFDIGVMPLADDEWSKGKSGTKLLQYMAAGVPAVASPVGINGEIIRDGENGFLAPSPDAWLTKISYLINDKALAGRVCQEARRTVEENYSVEVSSHKLLKVIREVLKPN